MILDKNSDLERNPTQRRVNGKQTGNYFIIKLNGFVKVILKSYKSDRKRIYKLAN